GSLSALPTTSNEGITGSWSPALSNTATTLYTFTPNAGQCATTQTMTITVNPIVTPTFTAVAPICAGGTLTALPTTSNNGITGSWSPALNNTATTVYTFTPNAGQCATTQTMTIVVNPVITPTFTSVAPICSGEPLTALPTTSNNGITGTWSPTLNNTATTTYTFTPNAGQCATTQTMTIVVNPIITPTFNFATTYCSGVTPSPLATTSLEGVTGTWSPAFNNMVSGTYTFTPTAGQCAVMPPPATILIIQAPSFTVTNAAPVLCDGESVNIMLSGNIPGATYTWTASTSNISSSFISNGDETNINQPVHLVNPLVSGSITFSIASSTVNGCPGEV
ncbi:gliding motility-associated C-terminal domain-containing protein, partial [Flavobacterium pedocola]